MSKSYTRRDVFHLTGRAFVGVGGAAIVANLLPGCAGDEAPREPSVDAGASGGDAAYGYGCYQSYGDHVVYGSYTGMGSGYYLQYGAYEECGTYALPRRSGRWRVAAYERPE